VKSGIPDSSTTRHFFSIAHHVRRMARPFAVLKGIGQPPTKHCDDRTSESAARNHQYDRPEIAEALLDTRKRLRVKRPAAVLIEVYCPGSVR
jgi:hypothetical protein